MEIVAAEAEIAQAGIRIANGFWGCVVGKRNRQYGAVGMERQLLAATFNPQGVVRLIKAEKSFC